MTTLEFIQSTVILGLAIFAFIAAKNLKHKSGKKKNNG